MRVFISSALTHVPREVFAEYVAFLHHLSQRLENSNHGIEVEYALRNSDPQLAQREKSDRAKLCYEWDSKMVERADILIAECSFPSIGVGIELQIAKQRAIPTVICYSDFGMNRAKPVAYTNPDRRTHDLQIGDGFVTLMALGMPMITDIVKYRHPDEGVERLLKLVDESAERAS
jgi:hypothetical protein